MSRYARRVDGNHAAIVAHLRAAGCAVLDLHALPGGLDLLIGFRGRLWLVEVKDGAKSASRRALTPAEVATIESFQRAGCPVLVVLSADEALTAIGAIDAQRPA